MAVDPKLVQTLFLQAVELPRADRQAFLDKECAGNRELREQVEAFLLAHDQPEGVLDRPLLPVDFASTAAYLPTACFNLRRVSPPAIQGTVNWFW